MGREIICGGLRIRSEKEWIGEKTSYGRGRKPQVEGDEFVFGLLSVAGLNMDWAFPISSCRICSTEARSEESQVAG